MVELIYTEFEDCAGKFERSEAFLQDVVNGVQEIEREKAFNEPLSGEVYLNKRLYYADSWLDDNKFTLYIMNIDFVRVAVFGFRL